MGLNNPSSTAIANQVYKTGLIAQYAFTETTGTVVTDSSGNGNNATYVGSPTLTGAGATMSGGTAYITLPNGVWTAFQTVQIFCDSSINGSLAPNGCYGSMMGATDNASLEFWQAQGAGTSSASYATQFPAPTLFRNNTSSFEFAPAGLVCFSATMDLTNTANDRIFINDHEVASYNGQNHQAGTKRGSSGQLGASAGSNVHYMNGNIYYVLFYSTILTPAQIASNYNIMKNIMLQRGNLFVLPNASSTNNNIVGIGDSITLGYGLTTPSTQNWLAQMTTTDTFTKVNAGDPSIYLSQLNYSLPQLLSHGTTVLGARNVAVILAGTNDMNAGGLTAAQTLPIMRAACTQARNAGYKVIAVSPLNRNSIASKTTGLTALMDQYWRSFADEYAAVGDDPYIGLAGTSTNTTYFQADFTHPTAAGQLILANIIAAAVNRLSNSENFALQGRLLTLIAAATVTNTTTETTLIGTLSANSIQNIPPYFWYPGKSIAMLARGVLSTAASSPGTLDIKLKLGSTIIADTTAFTVPTSLSANQWEAEFEITCVTSGGIGTGGAITNATLIVDGRFNFQSTTGSTVLSLPMVNSSSVSLDTTTAALLLNLTATWGTASASNSITATNINAGITN